MAICAIGFLGFMVWGHHMFVSGMSPYSGFAFSVLTMSIGVPSAIKTFNWLGTLWGGKIQFKTPMLFAIGFVSLFVSGGLSGLVSRAARGGQPAARHVLRGRSLPPGDGRRRHLRNFRRHLFLVPENVRPHDERAAWQIHFWFTFVGAYCIFMPMHWVGIAGGIRRYADASAVAYLRRFSRCINS